MSRSICSVVLALFFSLPGPVAAELVSDCDTANAEFGTGDAPSITREIVVPDHDVVFDMEVTVNLTHPWTGDVILTLESPAGTQLELFADEGDGEDIDLIFSGAGVEFGSESFTCFCRMKPAGGNFAVFEGEDTAGSWLMTAEDTDLSEDSGKLNWWCLYFQRLRQPRETACSSGPVTLDMNDVTYDTVTITGDWSLYEVEVLVDIDYPEPIYWLAVDVIAPSGVSVRLFNGLREEETTLRALFSNAAVLGKTAPYDCNCLRSPWAGEGALAWGGDFAQGDWTLAVDAQHYTFEESTLNEWCVRVIGAPVVPREWYANPSAEFDDGGEVSSMIEITEEEDEIVEDVFTYVDVNHFAGIQDLRVTLTSPAGTEVTLHDQQGDGGQLEAFYSRTGSAHGTVPYVSTFFEGVFLQPSGPGGFEDMTGESTAGEWTLTCRDMVSGNSSGGILDTWGIGFSRACDVIIREQANIPFDDNSGTPPALITDDIEVNETWAVEDIEVMVNIQHPWMNEVKVQVSSPAGISVTLHDYQEAPPYHQYDNRLTWSDRGHDYVLADTLSFVELYFMEPSGPGVLADLAGEVPAGDWTLTVSDEKPNGDTGTLYDWLLRVYLGAPRFKRGDVNGNGSTEGLQDTIALLNYAFLNGQEPICMKAADVNGNGVVNGISDSIALLNWAFLGRYR